MILGIDLGGTKIAFALYSIGEAATPVEVCKKIQYAGRVATPHEYPATLALLGQEIQRLGARFGKIEAIGIGLPGALTPLSRRIKNANSEWLIGQDLRGDLERATGISIVVANDANCFALAEASGAEEALFGVILGTGVGGGLIVRGQMIEGANGVAGEWGHLTLPADLLVEGLPANPMRPCYCGNRGCIEGLLSGPALSADILLDLLESPKLLKEAVSLATDSDAAPDVIGIASLREAPNLGMRLRELFPERGRERAGASSDLAVFSLAKLLDQGASLSEELRARIEAAKQRYFARATAALKLVVQVADPEIVLGGGLSSMSGLVEELCRRLPLAIFNAAPRDQSGKRDMPVVKVRVSRHGDDAGVLGAAILAGRASRL